MLVLYKETLIVTNSSVTLRNRLVYEMLLSSGKTVHLAVGAYNARVGFALMHSITE